MSISEDTTLNLVGMVYDAALDQHKWPTFLEAFALTVGGVSSMLRSVDLQTNAAGFVASVGYDPAWQSACFNFRWAKSGQTIRFLAYQSSARPSSTTIITFRTSRMRWVRC